MIFMSVSMTSKVIEVHKRSLLFQKFIFIRYLLFWLSYKNFAWLYMSDYIIQTQIFIHKTKFDLKGHLRFHKVIFIFENKDFFDKTFFFRFDLIGTRLPLLKPWLTLLWTTFVLVLIKFEKEENFYTNLLGLSNAILKSNLQ